MSKLFEGITVVDFTQNLAGPTATAMLADFGARIIKIERPIGDDSRRYSPQKEGRAINELWLNRGKESVRLDMNDPEAIVFLKKLIEKADILVEAFKPGTMKKYGLDYDTIHALKPSLVYCSVSAYGQTGPMAKEGGYDTLIQALAGMMYMTGEPDGEPTKLGFPVVDYGTAHNAFAGICAAMYYREKTGLGQWVNIDLFSVACAQNNFIEQTSFGFPAKRAGNISVVVAPVGNYTGKHGTLCISCNNDSNWKKFAVAIGREDLLEDPGFKTNAARSKNTYVIRDMIIDWMNGFDDIRTPEKILKDAGVPCGKVNDIAEAIELAKYIDCGAVGELRLSEGLGQDTVTTRGVFIKLSETPGELSPCSHKLGEDTLAVLASCGYSDEEANKLAERWKA